jgi:hypothetical protein
MTRQIAIERFTECLHLEIFKVLRSFAFVAYYIVFDRKRKFCLMFNKNAGYEHKKINFCCLSSDIAVRSEVKEANGYAIVDGE